MSRPDLQTRVVDPFPPVPISSVPSLSRREGPKVRTFPSCRPAPEFWTYLLRRPGPFPETRSLPGEVRCLRLFGTLVTPAVLDRPKDSFPGRRQGYRFGTRLPPRPERWDLIGALLCTGSLRTGPTSFVRARGWSLHPDAPTPPWDVPTPGSCVLHPDTTPTYLFPVVPSLPEGSPGVHWAGGP